MVSQSAGRASENTVTTIARERRKDGIYYTAILDRINLVVLRVFGFGHDLPLSCVTLANELIELSSIYFFGDWRNGAASFPADPPLTYEQTRQQFFWFEPYQSALTASVLLQDHAFTRKLADWPGMDLGLGDSQPDYPPEHQLFYSVLAEWTKHGVIDAKSPFYERVSAGKKREPKIMLRILEAMVAGDRKSFLAELKRGVEEYRRRRMVWTRPDRWISAEYTILVNLAMGKCIERRDVEPYEQWLLFPEDVER